jgi:hypothetical protein
MPEKFLPSGVVIVDINEASGLIKNFAPDVGHLDIVKRGDFVRLLLKFTGPATRDFPAGAKGTEFLTCVVASKTSLGLLKAKVFSRPEMTPYHSVTYGDDLTLSERYVLNHEQSSLDQVKEVEPFLTGVIPVSEPINAEDAKLRAATKNLPPLKPEPDKEFWLRNGTRVKVWVFHSGFWVGAPVDSSFVPGSFMEWTATGASAGGNREFDIVKDPMASEVL